MFVVCYGVKESLIGEWSWINSSILIIHCYFNVWQRLQAGWKSYLLRREAAEKIESLPLATEEQLRELDDVCAICFQEMAVARVTPCNHIFHAVCLKKWLYVQKSCPMCHQNIDLKNTENQTAEGDNQQNENRENDNQDQNADDANDQFHNAQENIAEDFVHVDHEGQDVSQNDLTAEPHPGPSHFIPGSHEEAGGGDAPSLLHNKNTKHVTPQTFTGDRNQSVSQTNSSQGTSEEAKASGEGRNSNTGHHGGGTSKEMLHMAFMMALFLMLSLTTIYCYMETI